MKKKRMYPLGWLGIGILCILLGGCGQSGPLYLAGSPESSASSPSGLN